MFPARGFFASSLDADPRASGGVSKRAEDDRAIGFRSPRKRGCFSKETVYLDDDLPIPAQAGVFPRSEFRARSPHSDPRASGGVSLAYLIPYLVNSRSPRKRGCFRCVSSMRQSAGPIPAQAGVFPNGLLDSADKFSDPRASGGVSALTASSSPLAHRSPRKRGCFPQADHGHGQRGPIPAQAGVFPGGLRLRSQKDPDPRASGGVSSTISSSSAVCSRSPRKRGCFLDEGADATAIPPIPAQAGVFPRSMTTTPCSSSDPRASGGVSLLPSASISG